MSDLIHGGDLVSAAQRYGIAVEDWLDLSTGINPAAYPVPQIDAALFQRLPYQSQAFSDAVANYYGGEGLACNGTQQAIELLPKLLPERLAGEQITHPALLPDCGYQEHRYSWQQAGAALKFYCANDHQQAVSQINQQLTKAEPCHLLLINPNNPTGLQFSPEQIFSWAEQMIEGSYLIVDEAFIDLCPEQSLLNDYDRFQQLGNLIVLRSFGKFFGLAGIRLGFVFAEPRLLNRLKTELGAWAVNGPAQAVAIDALNNQGWQQQARQQIAANAEVTQAFWQPLFDRVGAELLCSRGLFLSARLESEIAEKIYQFLAERGVLIRLVRGEELGRSVQGISTEQSASICLLRSGLIDATEENQCKKLEQVISELLLTLE